MSHTICPSFPVSTKTKVWTGPESWVIENLGIQKIIKALKFYKNYFGFVCFHGVDNHLDTMKKKKESALEFEKGGAVKDQEPLVG